MTDRIGEYSVSHLLTVAEGVVAKKTADSVLLDNDAESRIPKFQLNELSLGRVLGRGGFCVVNEVTKISPQGGDEGALNIQPRTGDEFIIHNIVQDRSFMARHCIRPEKDNRSGKDDRYRYAIKRVQEKSRQDAQHYVNAVVDLATEARFLAVIRHANIIKMRAMEDASLYSDGFFLVLDKLYDIMPVRLKKWKKQKGGSLKKLLKSKDAKNTFWVERLSVAYDLACALSYLHGMSVIYRDLKPDNIGFDVRGDVKIFDFGLAKELDTRKKLADGTYNLTGDTGSPRYMAPEVFLSKPYNETADSYSFSILCWQILAIETPFDHITTNKMFEKSVIRGGVRPKVREEWGPSICKLLREGFVDNPKRPSMAKTCERLRKEINRLSDEDIDVYLDESPKKPTFECLGIDLVSESARVASATKLRQPPRIQAIVR
eukprot:CAMPEP_0172369216 /NCGR_PEP_ID=MMETSP1060-20121228/31565_1 /TAXON_ID=37318 /ORGANISM="Pseudo-nitzschia pungens, Strain cf. cingulata" /LENGTH=431 /DNA_ID=CAMNT_0013094059 /DNA_START=149 /DNA_END=1443 /DNA_ORIENTATION=+